MAIEQAYQEQVKLLLDVLPFIKQEEKFALKGGTAINLFVRNMPRLSVDIDLTYLDIEPRDVFLRNLTVLLDRLSDKLEASGFLVDKKYTQKGRQLLKLLVSNGNTNIKVEPNLVLRGSVFGTEEASLTDTVQESFLQAQKIKMLSVADLYAGKICAALDRQHPRDLFDIKLLLENEGITPEIRQAFVVYLASSNRPMHELLSPNMIDMRDIYEKEFLGMTDLATSYEELNEAREELVKIIQSSLTDSERQFLLSIKMGHPNWALLPIPGIKDLPGLKWKLINIKKIDDKKHSTMVNKLKLALEL